MNLHSISSLITKNGLYDITDQTYKNISGLNFSIHIVLKEEEGRIDLICYNILNTTDYLDLLMEINDIDNPLNVMEGDIIYYVSTSTFDSYKVNPKSAEATKILLNQNKSNLKDSKRIDYVDNNYKISPTFLDTPGSPISYSNGKITISPL